MKSIVTFHRFSCNSTYRLRYWNTPSRQKNLVYRVATVPTVYGIETNGTDSSSSSKSGTRLQQYLPFTVLKLVRSNWTSLPLADQLQQYLPFTVLKPKAGGRTLVDRPLQQYLPFTVLKLQQLLRLHKPMAKVATVPTVYGIETSWITT